MKKGLFGQLEIESSKLEEGNVPLFTGNTLLITGDTGSFGNVVLNHFPSTDIGEIRIFSHDEKK